jgi:hypothetical protein
MPYLDDAQRFYAETYGAVDVGQMNYLVTKVVNDYLVKTGVTYARINEAIGALECAKLELYRRIAAPYEDKKLVANGDVYSCTK